MKNLKYIYALSSLFVSFFAFSYATNFNDTASTSTSDDTSKENSNTTQDTTNQSSVVIDDVIKNNIINSYNSALSSTHTLKLNKGNLVYRNNNKPVTLDFSGLYLLSSNSLNSYVIDASYNYDSSKESFNVVSGTSDYSTITYNDNVYLFSSSNELGGILSFPSTVDNKYPLINLDFKFSTLLNDVLKLDYSDYNVYSSSTGYTFINDNTSIKVDSDYNLLEVKSNYNDYLSYSLSFNELDSSTSSSKVNEESENFITTLKELFNDSNFNIDYKAEIKSSVGSNLKYNGNVSSSANSLSLSVNEYKDNNLLNQIESTYLNNNVYFNVSNGYETGYLEDIDESNFATIVDGLMSADSSFDYSFNSPLNNLINTNEFESILNGNYSSSYIESLSENSSLVSFKINSLAFGLKEEYFIRFDLELENYKLKKISIKDYKSDDNRIMNVEFNINNTSNVSFKLNTDSYPIYNSLLPYYKKVTFIVNEIKAGGKFATSIIQNSGGVSTTLGLSTTYDVNLGKSINNIKLEDLNVALTGLTVNYKDSSNPQKNSSLATALFLMDTSSDAKTDFDITIDSVNYKNKKFYIELIDSDTETVSRYTLEKDSLSGLIQKINQLSGSNNTTTDGTSKITDQITKISDLINGLQYNLYFIQLKKAITQNMSFSGLKKYMEINVNQDSNLEVKFKLSNIFGGSSPLFDVNMGKFSENTEVNLTLSKDDSKILSLGISEIKSTTKNTNDDGTSSTSTTTVSNTSIGLNKFNEKNILTDTVIKDEWENEESEKKAKDLNEVVSKITDVVDVYGSMIQKSSVLQNLITIDFAYTDNRDESKKKSISLQGKLASKIHFNDKCNIDDKYIEGYIPLNITQTTDSSKDTTNSINKVNLQFIYSDNDASESHFTNYLEEENTNRLKAGTQIGLSLGYASGADRSGSKLYAYSDHETVNSMLQSLSTIGKENTLWPYEIIRTVQAYSLNIESLINKKDISTTKILENLGINKSSNLINLLNGLNTSKDSDIETLTAKVNLGNLTGDIAFNNLDVNVTLNFKIGTKESTNDKGETINVRTVSLTSIDLQNVESSSNITLKVSLNLDNSLIQKDEVTDKTPLNDSTILSNFEPINGSSKYYIDAANLYNLLELGIYITNKKYYNIQGTLSFNSSVDLGLSDSLSVDNFTVLNNLNFDIKLNLYKNKPDNFNSLTDDEKNEQYYNKIYDIKGYLKVAPIGQQDYNFTEFMIEEDKIYVYKCSPNATEVTVEENTTVDPDNFNQYYDFFETSTNHLDSGTYKENGEELHFDFIEIITQTVSKKAADKKIDELAKQYGVKKDEKDDYFKCREGTSGSIIKKHYYYIEVLKEINNTTYTYKKYDNPTNTYNVQSYWMSKKTFLGDMNVINDSKGTIQVPRLMYYILDYSQVIKDSYAKVKYQALWGTKYTVGTIAVKNLMLANIFSSVTSDSGATLDYLSGWKFEINSLKSDDKIIITDGCFTIDPKSLIKKLDSGTGSLSFNCGINLSFKKDETDEEKDTWTFELSQTDTTNNIVTASMGSMSLNVKLEISKFDFTCSDNEDFISSEMKRMNDFIEEFNSNESTNKLGEYYIDTIETSEYSIGYSSGLYVSCKYNVSFNSESNRYNNSKCSEDNIGHL